MVLVRRKAKIKPDNVLRLLADVVAANMRYGLRVGGKAKRLLRAYRKEKK